MRGMNILVGSREIQGIKVDIPGPQLPSVIGPPHESLLVLPVIMTSCVPVVMMIFGVLWWFHIHTYINRPS